MKGKIAKLSNINFWYESFGEVNNPCVLLIMGAGSQGILWPDDFCLKLASNGFYVIRYDHRDTGLSTCINYNEAPYSLHDLANDAISLLQYLNINKAHFVGLSMGGHIVQILAINRPEYFLSATLIMSTPNHMVFMNALSGKDVNNSLLPPPKEQVIKFLASPPENLNNREAIINYSLETWRLLNGKIAQFDENYWRDLIEKHYDRIQNHISQYNHGLACLATPDDRTELLKAVKVPTLILHGLEDPALPPEHGEALAHAMPKSTLYIIPGMGHALNPIFVDLIVNSIVKHLTSNFER